MADMGFLPAVQAPPRPRPAPTARRCCSRPRSTATSTCWSAATSATRAATRSTPTRTSAGDVRHLFWRVEHASRVAAHRRRGRPATARPSCSAAPSTAPTGSPSSSARRASPAVAIHGNRSQAQRERALADVRRRPRARPSWPPTSPPAASTSTTSAASSTSTRRPTTRTTCTARAAPAAPAPTAPSCRSWCTSRCGRRGVLQRALGMAEGVGAADVELLGERVPMKPMRPIEAPQPASTSGHRRSDGAGERARGQGREQRGRQGRARTQSQPRRSSSRCQWPVPRLRWPRWPCQGRADRELPQARRGRLRPAG